MRRELALVCAAASGFLIGAVAAHIATRKTLEAVYAAKSESEIEEVRVYYGKKYTVYDDESTQDTVPYPLQTNSKDSEPEESTTDNEQNETEEGEKVVFFSEIHEPFPPIVDGVPYFIVQEETDLDDEQELLALMYYRDCGTVTDEDDVLVDPEELLGQPCYQYMQDGHVPLTTCYIRNKELGMDFEILMNDGRFAELVLGMPPAEG